MRFLCLGLNLQIAKLTTSRVSSVWNDGDANVISPNSAIAAPKSTTLFTLLSPGKRVRSDR